jgi:hypothetical protein
MNQFTDPDRRDYLRSVFYISVYLLVISVSAFLLLPRFWYLWTLLVLVGMLLLVNWHKTATVYRCPNCSHIYTVSFLQDLAAPHGIGCQGAWLLLRCPKCKQKCKTKVLKRVD